MKVNFKLLKSLLLNKSDFSLADKTISNIQINTFKKK